MRRAIQVAAGVALAFPGAARAASQGGYPTVPQHQHGGAFTYHGIVQAHPRIVLVFWGPSWAHVPFERQVVVAEKAMFRQLAGTAYAAILDQYGVHNDTRLEATVIDTRSPPPRRLRDRNFRSEILRASRLAGVANTFDTQWEVFPSDRANLTGFQGFCGENGGFWHGRAHWGYTITLPFDDSRPYGGCLQADGGGQSLVGASTSATSHEWAELATDPLRNNNDGWWINIGRDGLEQIADPCFTQGVIPQGMTATVQALWSNASQGPGARRGCVQSVWGGVPRCVGGDRPGDACGSDSRLVAARRR